MSKHIAIVVDWFGPYKKNEAIDKCKTDFSSGLYILHGKTKFQKKDAMLQYVGIAGELCLRVNNNHHIIPKLKQQCTVWLGEVATFGIPGKKSKITDRQLDLAEWLHSYFLQLPLNVRKKTNPPDSAATVLNRWWKKDFLTPRRQRPYKEWPDLIDFTGTEYGAKVVWFGGKIEKWTPDDF